MSRLVGRSIQMNGKGPSSNPILFDEIYETTVEFAWCELNQNIYNKSENKRPTHAISITFEQTKQRERQLAKVHTVPLYRLRLNSIFEAKFRECIANNVCVHINMKVYCVLFNWSRYYIYIDLLKIDDDFHGFRNNLMNWMLNWNYRSYMPLAVAMRLILSRFGFQLCCCNSTCNIDSIAIFCILQFYWKYAKVQSPLTMNCNMISGDACIL